MRTEHFFIYAADETKFWDEKVLQNYKITHAYCLYLIHEEEATYCCSLSPSSFAIPVYNVFQYRPGTSDEEMEQAEEELMFVVTGHENGTYFNFFGADKCSPDKICQFDIDVDDSEFNFTSDEEHDAYRNKAWDEALEYVRCNSMEPKCCYPRFKE